MSGRNKFRELARPIDEDPVRRARVEELSREWREEAEREAAEEERRRPRAEPGGGGEA